MRDTARAPIRVLVVDDEDMNLSIMKEILSTSGFEVDTAANGEDCLRMAAGRQPDIILLDVQMPGMSGYSVATVLRGEESTASIPIVMVTGLDGKAERLRALSAGAMDFLHKPVDPEELRAKVRSLARLKAYHDEMKRRKEELDRALEGQSGRLSTAMETFARFVPDEFIKALGKQDISTVKLGDHVRRHLAILFSDIRSFTTLSEKLTPEENFAFLNSYLRRMNPFVWENGGFIDKYIGDAIMALFPDGAESAVEAAVAMLAHIPVYNAQRATFGYSPIRIGIGVHAGSVMLGVIGHERFMQGTAISSAVNLASRLQDLTKFYGVSLVISSAAISDLGSPDRFAYRFLDKLKVRGQEEAVSVYEVFEADEPVLRRRKGDSRDDFERAVGDFHGGRFAEALAGFEKLRNDEAPDPPVEIYRSRCRRAMNVEAAAEDTAG